MILIDSNVLLDILDEDSEWHGWSSESLVRAATLPDFFIGAHAAVARYRILTRDRRRFRRYFPSVELIAP